MGSVLTIAYNAMSSHFWKKFPENSGHQEKRETIFIVILIGCIAFDLFSSFLGTIAGIVVVENGFEAVERATFAQLVFTGLASTIMVMSPFICSKFVNLLKNCTGP